MSYIYIVYVYIVIKHDIIILSLSYSLYILVSCAYIYIYCNSSDYIIILHCFTLALVYPCMLLGDDRSISIFSNFELSIMLHGRLLGIDIILVI